MNNKVPLSGKLPWFRRLLPHPLLSFILLLGWLLLNHSIDAAQLLIGVLAGILIPKLTQLFVLPSQTINWIAALKLFFIVCLDIVIANFHVARLVLGRVNRLQPAWIRIPLDSDHPKVNTFLALIITTTPGTVSVGLDDEKHNILVHALDTTDPDAIIAEVKTRYEQRLLAIFNVQPLNYPEESDHDC